MRKEAFLDALRAELTGLPQAEADERVTFYSEMIDDRMEEGLREEEAVAAVGSVDEIVGQIGAEIPLTTLVRARVRPKRALRAWEVVLLVLGAPLWLPLLLAAAAVLLSLYITLWAVVLSFWAVDLSIALAAPCAAILGIDCILRGNIPAAVALFGAAAFCVGVSIFLFFGCAALTKGIARGTRKRILGMKKHLIGKEEA